MVNNSFLSEDKVIIKPVKHIKKCYHNKLGNIVKWICDDIYYVDVDGKEIVLHESEMIHVK